MSVLSKGIAYLSKKERFSKNNSTSLKKDCISLKRYYFCLMENCTFGKKDCGMLCGCTASAKKKLSRSVCLYIYIDIDKDTETNLIYIYTYIYIYY